MKLGFKNVAIVLAATLVVSGCAFAQFDVDGTNAALRLNGQDPSVSDPTDHDVLVGLPGLVIWEVITGANAVAPIIFIDSLIDPTTGSTLPGLPWGGSIDIGTFTGGIPGNLVLRGDGLGLTVNPLFDPFFVSDNGNALLGLLPTFTQAMSAHTGFNGLQVASQCIVRDVTAPPFFLDNTQACSAEFIIGQTLLALTGDDGSVNIPFVAGNRFDFHGVTKNDIWLNGNGYVNFNNLTTVGAAGFTNDDVGAANAEPGIFIGMTDWSIDGFGFGDGILHEELGTNLRVSWGDPVAHSQGGCPHFADIDLNTFEIVMQLNDMANSNPNSGQFELRSLVLDPTAFVEFGNGLLGHTPGGAAVNPASVVDINLRTGINVGLANDGQFEEHDFDGFAATRIGHDGLGTPRGYNNYTINWNGNVCLFLPNAGVIPGDNGYTNLPLGALPADDCTGILANSIANTGGTTEVAVGSFFGFDPLGSGAGTVTLDTAGAFGGPFVCAINGIYDNTGQAGALSILNPGGAHRDGQGLEFVTPPLGAGGTYDLVINFASGFVFNGSVLVTAPGITVTSYTLGDDAAVTHAFVTPLQVMFYGVLRTSLILNSNGFVSTTSGSGDFTETSAEFFSGWGFAGNAGVALAYCDLNRNGTASGATYDVAEDTVLQTVQVQYTNQNWWNSTNAAGTFSVTFLADGVNSQQDFNFASAINDAGNADTPITGITDGVTGGNDTILASYPGILTYAAPGAMDSFMVQGASGSFQTNMLTVVGGAGAGQWTSLDTGVGYLNF